MPEDEEKNHAKGKHFTYRERLQLEDLLATKHGVSDPDTAALIREARAGINSATAKEENSRASRADREAEKAIWGGVVSIYEWA